jgi:hypothetical protein
MRSLHILLHRRGRHSQKDRRAVGSLDLPQMPISEGISKSWLPGRFHFPQSGDRPRPQQSASLLSVISPDRSRPSAPLRSRSRGILLPFSTDVRRSRVPFSTDVKRNLPAKRCGRTAAICSSMSGRSPLPAKRRVSDVDSAMHRFEPPSGDHSRKSTR